MVRSVFPALDSAVGAGCKANSCDCRSLSRAQQPTHAVCLLEQLNNTRKYSDPEKTYYSLPYAGARRAKILQQQQLQAAMAATAAANAAAAAAAAASGGDLSQSVSALGMISSHNAVGSMQPAATAVSGSAPAAAGLATDHVPIAAPTAAAAAGMQQQAGTLTAAAGSGPAWYEKVLQLTQTVVDSLEPAMRGQYKVIHMLRCPVITGVLAGQDLTCFAVCAGAFCSWIVGLYCSPACDHLP